MPSIRPFLLKGHERAISSLKYNREGDLIFTCSRSPIFAVWYTSNGERLGTYDGHLGAVWALDIDRHTTKVLSASADNTAKLWDAELGKELASWMHKAPVRDINFALGDKQYLCVTDQVMGNLPSIYISDLGQNPRESRPIMEIPGKNEAKILRAVWGPLNRTILTANEDGTVRIYDTRNGKEMHVIADHTKAVMEVKFDKTQGLFITASKDGYSKLYDAETFENIKTYHTGRPINSASISPIKEEVILGGGMSAENVTTSRADMSQFRVKFYHMIFEEEVGSIAAHFGPVNVLSYSPDGTGFASGGEDGYIRLHHFDDDYFKFGMEP